MGSGWAGESGSFNPTRVRLELAVSVSFRRRLTSFNPTRVRLEPASTCLTSRSARPLQPHEGSSGTPDDATDDPDPDPASTPRGFVWNVLDHVVHRRPVDASTPRGFVWNERDGVTPRHLPQLQPHEGSSGTLADLLKATVGQASTPRGFVWNTQRSRRRPRWGRWLQPHEGSSGTVRRASLRPPAGRFNPTRVRLEPALSRLTRPREAGFNPTRVRLERSPNRRRPNPELCFNPTRVRLELVRDGSAVGREVASTPRGFVWNAVPVDEVAPDLASTPRGFVWNRCLWVFLRIYQRASTPRGFVWN